MRHSLVPVVLVTAVLAASSLPSRADGTAGPPCDARIWAVAQTLAGASALVAVDREPPWSTSHVASLDSVGATVQSFGGAIYVVEPATGLVRVFDGDGVEGESMSVGAGTAPRDILSVARNRAYVTRAASTHLYRVDPITGVGAEVVDLGAFGGADGVPDMERMATDGERLFVQLRLLEDGLPTSDGAIAVVDLRTETLIDAIPGTREIDAIELLGPAPRLRMHVDAGAGVLLVSATNEDHLDVSGGIELIDLATLTSEGFVLNEFDLASLGGFVVTGADAGYFVFHTDIVPSNHLKPFTLDRGAEPGPEIVFDWGVYLDALLHDAATERLFMPAAAGGLFIVDTTTDTPVTEEPIELPGPPIDMIIGPVGHPYDLTGDGRVDVDDLVTLILAWGDCPAPCPPTCVADIAGPDCAVDVDDLILLLSSWGG